jgi:anti-sigma B factor antagonist
MKNITITVTPYPQHKDITLLSVKGFIDTNTAPEFDKSFQGVLGENKFKLVVDLKDVNYISSAGWGLFVGEIKRIRSQKGDLFLVAMSPEVEEAYDLLQFSTILKAFPTVEQAVQKGFGRAMGTKASAESPVESGAELQPVGKAQSSAASNVGMSQPATEPSKPKWFERLLNPSKWF